MPFFFWENHKNSGKKICVYGKDNEKSFSIAKKLFSEGRVYYFINADYSENSEPDKLIKEFIISYLSKSLLNKFNNLWFNNCKL
jgi:hypothetical protein